MRHASGRHAAPLLILLATLGTARPVRGQDVFTPGAGPYDPAVPTVAALRGFPTGATFSTDAEIERVLTGLAQASDRIVLETYGTSVEGRPLRLAWVSHPDHLARLDSLRAANAGLMHGGAIDPDAHPIFIWLSFGIHGDEAASPEAALELLYHLAAAEDDATEAWLERAIIVVDPLLNPDGHARYVTWLRSVVGERPDADPAAREHRPPWPGGRTSHWYFDLNRDWAWGIQPETRARVAAYLATLPQVHVDFHEMDSGSTYFFFPSAAPVHPFYPPSTAAWGQVFGAANATAFDSLGWSYYTQEDFDLFYPGYGDSWPSFHGATGMTYEQAGGGEAGLVLDRPGKERLTLDARVRHHFLAAVTTIATAVEHGRRRLADFAAFWSPAERVPPGAPAGYLVPPSRQAADLASLLVRQGIEVDTLGGALSATELDPYPGTRAAPDSLPAGTFFLRSDQPLGRYLAALMAPGTAPPDTSLFYDITGWALPFLYDVPAYRAARVPPVAAGQWNPPASEPALQARPESAADGGTRPVAFLWDYSAPADILAAGRLLALGFQVQIAERAFATNGERHRPGTFVVPVQQPDSVVSAPGDVARAIAAAGARARPLATFSTPAGVDLGSDRVRSLFTPRVALAAGPAIHPASLGAAWFLLEHETGLDLDVIRLEDLAAAPGADADSLAGRDQVPLDLGVYTAIVLPDGPGPGAYANALGEEGKDRLAAYVEAGGTVIGVRAGAAYLLADGSGLTDVEGTEEPPPTDAERRAPQAQREAQERRQTIPGTLLAARVDTTSVLGYGFPDGSAAIMAREPVEFTLADQGNAWTYLDLDPLAGYLPDDARARLPGTPYAVVAERGRGRFVLFADDPGFRGIMHALKKLYLNAVLLAPGSS